jgi:hypothetical protein
MNDTTVTPVPGVPPLTMARRHWNMAPVRTDDGAGAGWSTGSSAQGADGQPGDEAPLKNDVEDNDGND